MRRSLRDCALFLSEFRRTFHTTGAILPSSSRLARALARFVDGRLPGIDEIPSGRFSPARRVLEIGPGTGAVTTRIVARLKPEDRLELVELNERFVERLRERFAKDSRLSPFASQTTIHHAPVEELPGEECYDAIVSGLPLNNFSVASAEAILAAIERLVKPGGTLSFFEYIAVRPVRGTLARRAERERLRGLGRLLGEFAGRHEFCRQAVLLNVPPAWVHHLRFRNVPADDRSGSSAARPSTSHAS